MIIQEGPNVTNQPKDILNDSKKEYVKNFTLLDKVLGRHRLGVKLFDELIDNLTAEDKINNKKKEISKQFSLYERVLGKHKPIVEMFDDLVSHPEIYSSIETNELSFNLILINEWVRDEKLFQRFCNSYSLIYAKEEYRYDIELCLSDYIKSYPEEILAEEKETKLSGTCDLISFYASNDMNLSSLCGVLFSFEHKKELQFNKLKETLMDIPAGLTPKAYLKFCDLTLNRNGWYTNALIDSVERLKNIKDLNDSTLEYFIEFHRNYDFSKYNLKDNIDKILDTEDIINILGLGKKIGKLLPESHVADFRIPLVQLDRYDQTIEEKSSRLKRYLNDINYLVDHKPNFMNLYSNKFNDIIRFDVIVHLNERQLKSIYDLKEMGKSELKQYQNKKGIVYSDYFVKYDEMFFDMMEESMSEAITIEEKKGCLMEWCYKATELIKTNHADFYDLFSYACEVSSK